MQQLTQVFFCFVIDSMAASLFIEKGALDIFRYNSDQQHQKH